MINRIFGLFSHDLGIDLGTANTLVLVRGKGIVIREPSVVALHKKHGGILAIGEDARAMIGKAPGSISVIKPLREGVISDFEVTERMLKYFIHKVHQTPGLIPKIPRPRIVVGIPSQVTEVERRAVSDAAMSAGGRQVFLVDEPMAAAVGSGLPIQSPKGSFIADIGGGTTEIAVISLGGIVSRRSLRVAGNLMDEAIVDYARNKFNLLLGERTAEDIKIKIGSAIPGFFRDSSKVVPEMTMRGRDLASGLPRSVVITSDQVAEALASPIETIVQGVKDVVEETPPELVADILKDGLVMAGGGSQLPALARRIAQEVKMPVRVADDPLTCVVRGTGVLLEDLDLLSRLKVD